MYVCLYDCMRGCMYVRLQSGCHPFAPAAAKNSRMPSKGYPLTHYQPSHGTPTIVLHSCTQAVIHLLSSCISFFTPVSRINMDTRAQRQIAAGMELGMHLPVTSRLMWIAALLDSDSPGSYASNSSPCKLQSARLPWSDAR